VTIWPMDERDGWIWLDGAMVPWREAQLHVLSHGLHYASAVFEGERAYDGRLFRLEDHGRRLVRSAEILDLPLTSTADQLDDAACEVIAANGIADGYVRRIVWRGTEQIAVAARSGRAHVAIAAWPWPRYFEERAEDRGLALTIGAWRRPDPRSAPTDAKAACLYAIGTLAKHAAERAGFDDALLLDLDGNLTEATGANLFLVRDGAVHTPSVNGFLDGITRQTVIGLARELGITVVERTIAPDELTRFEAAFLTGTAVEVAPVGRVDDHRFTRSPLVGRIRYAYRDLVRTAPSSLALALAG
jgi:branched-chain amino acid aminotransferase